MFGNKKNKRNVDIDSLVGSNSKICGDVHFSGGLHVDGEIEGNVIANDENSTLTTSERARIQGDVKVHNIILNGEVVGDVYGYKHIELAAAARVNGNVYYNVIEMAMGAEVNGSLIHSITPAEKSKAESVSSTDELIVDEKTAVNQN